MAETQGKAGSSLSRRNFIKRAVGTALAVASIGSEIARSAEGRIATPYGIFYPTYESHTVGVDLSKVNIREPNWDAHYWEGNLPLHDASKESTQQAVDIMVNFYTGYPVGGKTNLDLLAKRGVALAQGDIWSPSALEEDLSSAILRPDKINFSPTQEYTTTGDAKVFTGIYDAAMLFLIGKYGYKAIRKGYQLIQQKFKDKLHEIPSLSEEQKSAFSRRDLAKSLLEMGATGTAAYLSAIPLVSALDTQNSYYNSYTDKTLPPTRAMESVIRVLNAWLTDTQPNDKVIFIRNLVNAHKMLTLAEDIAKKTGRKAVISYQFGLYHTGIEEFLVLGKEFCEAVMKVLPRDMWQTERNNTINGLGLDGFENISVMRHTNGNSSSYQAGSWHLAETLSDDSFLQAVR